MLRKAERERRTRETELQVSLLIDGTGTAKIETGVGFFDHMMTLFAFHSGFDLSLSGRGDLHVDSHHLVEDCGIIMGEALLQAMGEGQGIRRYASLELPMDEALVRVALDISGRPYLSFNLSGLSGSLGTFDAELVEEWFRAFSHRAGLTLHVDLIRGRNRHHIAEACFKGLGRALRHALSIDSLRSGGVPSSKGLLFGEVR